MKNARLYRRIVVGTLWLLSAPLAAQGTIESMRSDARNQLRGGHRALAYGQTDEAMAIIHADPERPENIELFYTARSQNAGHWVGDDAHNGWNREHLWPQSRGARQHPVKSDLHHLMPTDASVNQDRGSLDFDQGGGPQQEAPDTFLNHESFEPRDEIKGDVARALFYMDVRYEGTQGEPDLVLVNSDSVTPGRNQLGNLCTLLHWHRADPVSARERSRNSAIAAVQGNRNIFIDQPHWVDRIFSAACGQPSPSLTAEAGARQPLRIATWNIANLHHESGVALRSAAIVRDDEDYRRLEEAAESLDIDIAVLQEVGSPAALARVFPEEKWHMVMSDRYQPGAENLPAHQRDIYTAMVFAKSTFKTMPVVKTLTALSIEHIGFDRDGAASSRPTRAGIVADITMANQPLRLLGVHLKSFCHRWSLDPVADQSAADGKPYASRFACRTLRAQLGIVENWIEQQVAVGVIPIVLGDFNRDLNALNDQGESRDHFWLDLNDGTPAGLQLKKGPEGVDTVCWPNHRQRFEDHIDLIVYDGRLGNVVSVDSIEKHSMGFESDTKYRAKDKQKLSDHCPVVMTLSW